MAEHSYSNLYSLKVCLFLLVSNYFIVSHAQEYQHLIIYGQSLSVANQSWPPLSITPVDGNYMIGNQIWTNFGNTDLTHLTPLIADVASTTTTLPKKRDSYIYGECPLVAATNHIQLKTGGKYKFIASSCGTGGKTIEELSKEYYNPVYYLDFTNTLTYASSITSSIHCPAIFWMQGEQNYTTPQGSEGLTPGSAPCEDKATYKSLLLKMKNNLQANIMKQYNQTDAPLFITYQAGVQYTRGDSVAIGMAQLEASNENKDIVCAGPVYAMTDRDGHLDPNGYRWFGEMLGKVYYKTKILGEDFKPLQPLEIMRMDDSKKLKIRFLVPQPPLVLDTKTLDIMTGLGFEIFVNGSSVELWKVDVDNDCVYLTCGSDLTGDVEVIYAGTNNIGHGNLRDSDAYPAFFNYLDLDKKNSDKSYVYERDASETTLRPWYEPKDSDGIIYNKPYPLYNFCVAFYYKLKSGADSYRVPHLSTGISQTSLDTDTKVYLEGRTLQIKSQLSGISHIDLLDISGKTVAAFPVDRSNSQETLSFRLPSLSKGFYFVRIISSKRNSVSRLFVK